MSGSVTRREAIGLAVGVSACAALVWWAPDKTRVVNTVGARPRQAQPAQEVQPGTPPHGVDQEHNSGRARPAQPTRLAIDAIDVDEPVQALGLTEAETIEPPPGVVQWYTGSVVPGQRGNSVIAGHVTSPDPDVFHHLAQLAPGDRVTVIDQADVRRSFDVETTERIDKLALTSDPRVWGETERRMLVLITCDKDSPVSGRHHRGNLVVWAVLAPGVDSS